MKYLEEEGYLNTFSNDRFYYFQLTISTRFQVAKRIPRNGKEALSNIFWKRPQKRKEILFQILNLASSACDAIAASCMLATSLAAAVDVEF